MIDTLCKHFETQDFDLSFVRNAIIITDIHSYLIYHPDRPIFLPYKF